MTVNYLINYRIGRAPENKCYNFDDPIIFEWSTIVKLQFNMSIVHWLMTLHKQILLMKM